MIRRILVIFAILLLVTVGAALLYLFNRAPGPQPVPYATASAGTIPQSTPVDTEAVSLYGVMKGPYQGEDDPRWPIYNASSNQDPDMEWKTPISFYGKVVDDAGRPVAGATARLVWNDLSATGTSKREVVSDAGGLFATTGITGKGMSVDVFKAGYETRVTRNRTEFEYAAFWEPSFFEPNPAEPVVFQLRKMARAEPMLCFGPTLFRLEVDGTPAFFDLMAERKSTENASDIVVRLVRSERTNKKFDWKVTVEAVNGAGLINSRDEYLMVAPRNGYESQWTFEQFADDLTYKSNIETKFCVRTRGGQYARIAVRPFAHYREAAAVDLTVFLNPSGSPNLEYDPLKTVEPRE